MNLVNSGVSCDQFTADWDAVSGASSYVVEVSSDGFATLAATATPATNSASITGLTAGVIYEWRVAAVNTCGNSAWSANQNVTTDNLPAVTDQTPEACSDVAGGNSTSGVDLTALQSAIDGGAGLAFAWYTDAGLTTAVADPSSVTVNNGDDFFAEVGSGNCTSVASVTYTVVPLDDATFSYAGDPYCQYSANVSPAISGDAGIFSSTTGLVFVDATTGEIDLANSDPGTYTVTYTTSGTCPAVATQDITIEPASDPAFSYSSGTFCQDAGLQSPTVNVTGGTFSAVADGHAGTLIIDAGSGQIDPLNSDPGAYIITHAFTGACPTSATFDVTITTAPDATFSYDPPGPYCQADTDPVPDFNAGASAGVFSASSADLIINASTGVIDLSASQPGTYTVTNTIAAVGACAEVSHNVDVEILSTDDPAFSYSAAAYCQDDTNPVAAISGTTGGNFTSTAGLVIDPSTGEIDLAASTAGATYTVTYTTTGTCNASATFDVTINAVDDASFSYGSAAYCKNEPANPTATVTGTPGGTFSSATGLIFVNQFTGEIDLANTPAGTHDITYTTSGTCQVDSTISLNILDEPGATNQAPVICEDAAGSGSATFDLTSLESAVNGGAGLTFSWFTDAALASSVADPTSITVANTDTYYVQVDNGSCQSVGQVTFTVNNLPSLADQTPAVCEDAAGGGTATVDLTALEAAIDGGAGLTFSWFEDAGLTTPVVDPDNVSAADGSDYFASVSDGSCENVASVTYTVNALPAVSFSGFASPYCTTDGPVPLIGNQAPMGTFSGTGITDNGDGTATFSPAAAGAGNFNITYSYTDGNGCAAQSSQSVVVNNCITPVTANFIADVTSICDGQTVEFTDQSSGPVTDYSWSFGTGASPATATGPGPHLVTYTGVGSYSVSLTVEDGTNTNEEIKADYITVNPADDPGFAYADTVFCQGDPTPPVPSVNMTGGTFTATPAGLIIDSNTGAIDLALSGVGNYLVYYTTAGTCPRTDSVNIIINGVDDASFDYNGITSFCQSDANPVANITGAAGAFEEVTGIVWADSTTGEINLAASDTGSYTLTFNTSGFCPASATMDITIVGAPDASFSYASGTFCTTAGIQLPSQSAGTFSAPAGLTIDPNTGAIDPATSTIGGPYTVIHEIDNGSGCIDTETFEVSITGTSDATFNYSQPSYCPSDTDPAPVLDPGATVGTFSAAPSGLVIDAATGVVDLGASTAGSYTVTNSIPAVGSCEATSHSVIIEVLPASDASFSYAATEFCLNETTNPVPTISGTAGGSFSSSDPANFVVDAVSGEIDLAASATGTYEVTYTTTGSCVDSSTLSIILHDAENADFSYSASSYCISDPDPVPVVSGLSGGEFTSSDPANLVVDLASGTIDMAASAAGIYEVTYTTPGTSAGGCINSSTFSITLTESVTADAGLDGASCEFNYTLGASAPGSGTGTWTMINSPSVTANSTITDINNPTSSVQVDEPGVYQFQWEVVDGSCSDRDTVEVNFTEPLVIMPFVASATNCSTIGGAVMTSVLGGSGSYSYLWTPTAETDQLLDNNGSYLPGGIYRLDVTDNTTACTVFEVYAVGNTLIDSDVTITTTDNTCNGASGGEIRVDYPNDYNVTYYDQERNVISTSSRLGGETDNLSGLTGSTYFVTIEDLSNGCSTGHEVIVSEPAPIMLANVVTNSTSCSGLSDGSITMDVSGGNAPYTFEWYLAADDSLVSTDEDPSGLAAGEYYVTVGYSGGCQYTSSNYTINEPAALTAPVANAATAVGCGEFSFSWSDEGVTDYVIDVATDNTFSTAVTGYDSLTVSGLNLTVSGLTAEVEYFYRVRAVDSVCGLSPASNIENVITDAVTTPVAQTASGVTCEQFTANWSGVSDAVRYFLDVATDSAFTAGSFVAGYENLDVALDTSQTVSGLAAGSVYYYRLRTETGCGTSASSGSVSVNTVAGPGIPLNVVAANPVCDGFEVSWDLLANASGYIVEADDQADFSNVDASNVASGTSNTVSLHGLAAATTYHIRVIAQNACGTDTSAYITFDTEALPAVTDQTPEACSDVAGGNSTSGVDLTALQSAIDGGAGLAFAWYTDAGLTTAVADPSSVTVNNGDDFFAEVGSGNCTSVASVTYTVVPLDDATFSYAGDPYCQYSANVSPAISGDAGIFSSTTGLVFVDATTGEIDLANSDPGTYTVTYTTSGTCPAVATQDITIEPASDPAFSYSSGTFCQDAGLQSPTVNVTGGTFSAVADGHAGTLIIDAGSGQIDPLNSDPGAYIITHAFTGACPTSATFDVTITTAPDATFSYDPPGPYCQADTDPVPDFNAGASAGVFSASSADLIINASTGVIDLSASQPGTYTVTNTIAAVGACAEVSHNVDVEILSTDDPAFSYSAAAYCQDDTNPVAILDAGATPGGNFTSSDPARLIILDAGTGEVDLANSDPGTYTITYTTMGTCNASATFDVTINAVPDPTFSYASGTFCQDAGLQSPVVNETGGTFSAVADGHAGIMVIDAGSGQIDPLTSAAGTYIVTYLIDNGVCPRSYDFSVTITGTPDAAFSYNASYCQSDADPAPLFAPGASAGNFSAPAGLIIDPTSGTIDLDASIPDTYTVTNDIPALGACAGANATFDVTINGIEDASFSYSAAAYCQDETDPVPDITGVNGGEFSAPAGLSINEETGVINLDASDPGIYMVTYTSPGSTPDMCPGTFDFEVTIHEVPDAGFSYAQTHFCLGTAPVAATVNTAGGTFSNSSGLNFLDTSTGEIDFSGSSLGTHTITYEVVNGTCTAISTFDITITDELPAPDPSSINVSASSCEGFSVSWEAVSGADRYVLEAASDTGFTAEVTRDTVDAASLNYTFTTLSPETFSYYFRMWTIDACGNDGDTATVATPFNTRPAEECGCGLDPARASFTVTSENTNCPGSDDGVLMVYLNPMSTASPSRFEYSYASETDSVGFVRGGNSTGLVFIADSLAAGDYTVYVRDMNADPNSCDTLLSFSRTVSVQNNITVSSSPASCDEGGSISYSLPSSCNSGILYSISINSLDHEDPVYFDGNTAANLPEGSYEVVVINSDTNDTLAVFTESVFSTCSSNGGGDPNSSCSVGGRAVIPDFSAADCETGLGNVQLTVQGGEADTYIFRVWNASGSFNETISEQHQASFSGLPMGSYNYQVVTQTGNSSCEGSFPIVQNRVAINQVDYQLPACDDPVQTATVSVSLSSVPDPNAPYDVYLISGADTVASGLVEAGALIAEVDGVPTGAEYEVVVRARDTQSCPASQAISIPATGSIALSFTHSSENIRCFGEGGSVTVEDIVVADGIEFTINVINVNQTTPYVSRSFAATPNSFTFSNLEKGDYRVQIVQQQSNCGNLLTFSSPTFTIDGPDRLLSAAVPEVVEVTVNHPYGSILLDSIRGGGQPYEVRIAAGPDGLTTDWVQVSNSNPAIDEWQYEYTDLERGLYFIELRDGFGCSELYEVEIRYTQDLFIPNIITPNGDGDNDTFRIVNLDSNGDQPGAQMKITNRWGRVVFHSDNYTNDKAWDGGELADGIYYYTLLMPDGSKYNGWVEIWRGRTP
ncbi:MAG: fibronectin type III domain-containing protein [Cyclobacteriaceae bacterium]